MAEVLAPAQWSVRADAYRDRVEAFLSGHRFGQPHPIWDFLFDYYTLRPRQLRCWHPGYGVALTGDEAIRRYRGRRGYAVQGNCISVSDAYLRSRLDTVRFVARLLRSTADRQAKLNCFGMHEWAMVYRSEAVRHERVPLRLSRSRIDAVVESAPLQCSHFDAFRFFTPDAMPRNAGAPSRGTQHLWEQPGCLHANMDLYKWSYKLIPLIDSELLLDCLELAAAAREVDMRASPYDLRSYGYTPIAVEHAAGRAEYVRCQRAIAERAAPLRGALIERCDLLLRAAGCK
ncbi:3-methyladenine DNA glycosylase [Mycobacterium shimoidei]|uniref:3-methyladenine DNA glycosylase n=1 Tax=Mycobacterium shimoidei TaxID=29313 RepID=UPI00084954CE|nr:3-methyladenine DNA glycosylase [Mycobacterium shimoidei]MCV7259047.1 3-methyladenine DNA glycosylase [Mycobacterium shimoidei]ODR10762.1 3-methyladenine DNA glycosylase [Mycobacterium shimoidei]ORW83265.1 3-methyladenine DNA glycosylase [Mycobacterium shimoidei]